MGCSECGMMIVEEKKTEFCKTTNNRATYITTAVLKNAKTKGIFNLSPDKRIYLINSIS